MKQPRGCHRIRRFFGAHRHPEEKREREQVTLGFFARRPIAIAIAAGAMDNSMAARGQSSQQPQLLLSLTTTNRTVHLALTWDRTVSIGRCLTRLFPSGPLISDRTPRWSSLVKVELDAAAEVEMAAAAAATAEEYEEMLRVVEAIATRIRWRLRPHSKRRLLNDILFLCSGLRPVVLMDYGGTMPELQDNLCSLLHHARQESSMLSPLRLMLLSETEENGALHEFLSIQDLFSANFPVDADVDLPIIQPEAKGQMSEIPEGTTMDNFGFRIADGTSLVIDLSTFLESAQIALPSLNGWLLGYPVTYLFCNESAETATQNLSKHSLHIYRIYAVRCRQSAAKQSEQELMSFSVPCDMSTKRDEEPWAKSFLAHMNEKIKQCNHVWASVRMEIEVFHSQSGLIVL
uniref:Uncharacterized protein n=1 Tax=Oryza rufipogon TaxID=4529 RepID=A0A0E0QTT3_ORYRU